jgi:FkbM family methyltransferase
MKFMSALVFGVLTVAAFVVILHRVWPSAGPQRFRMLPGNSKTSKYDELISHLQVGKEKSLHKEIHKSLNVLGTILKWNDVMCKEIRPLDATLNKEELDRSRTCVRTHPDDFRKASFVVWSRSGIRHTSHTYLATHSVVVDVGGNIGTDAKQLTKLASNMTYIILEPVPSFYRGLVAMNFSNNHDVFVYNFGLAARQSRISVKEEGDATSIFRNVAAASGVTKNVTLRLESVTDFFTMLGVGCLKWIC